MERILVIIISDQTVQNLQFIREFPDIEKYIFITTVKMINKGCPNWIITASGINQDNVTQLLVGEFDMKNINKNLEQSWKSENYYYVNITGGTKLMSIAVKDFFDKKDNSEIFYLTGQQSEYLKLYPKEEKKVLTHKITLIEYLKSYGINFTKPGIDIHTTEKTIEETTKLYNYFNSNLNPPNNSLKEILKEIRDYTQKSTRNPLSIDEINGLKDFLKAIDFSCMQQGEINKSEAFYLTGRWLEEYTFLRIKKALNLTNDFIGIGLKLRKHGVFQTDNDFDVMFMWHNDLCIIECKTSHSVLDSNQKNKNELTTYIYKLDALQKEFGLSSKAYIFTLSNLPNPKNTNDAQSAKQIEDRLKFHRITLLTHQERVLKTQQIPFEDWLIEVNR